MLQNERFWSAFAFKTLPPAPTSNTIARHQIAWPRIRDHEKVTGNKPAFTWVQILLPTFCFIFMDLQDR
jgi:hypothetical protein